MELLVQQAEQVARAAAATAAIEGLAQRLRLAQPTEAAAVGVQVGPVKIALLAAPASSLFRIKRQQAEFLALPLHLNGLAQQV
jgi:hypothetical protein